MYTYFLLYPLTYRSCLQDIPAHVVGNRDYLPFVKPSKLNSRTHAQRRGGVCIYIHRRGVCQKSRFFKFITQKLANIKRPVNCKRTRKLWSLYSNIISFKCDNVVQAQTHFLDTFPRLLEI